MDSKDLFFQKFTLVFATENFFLYSILPIQHHVSIAALANGTFEVKWFVSSPTRNNFTDPWFQSFYTGELFLNELTLLNSRHKGDYFKAIQCQKNDRVFGLFRLLWEDVLTRWLHHCKKLETQIVFDWMIARLLNYRRLKCLPWYNSPYSLVKSRFPCLHTKKKRALSMQLNLYV